MPFTGDREGGPVRHLPGGRVRPPAPGPDRRPELEARAKRALYARGRRLRRGGGRRGGHAAGQPGRVRQVGRRPPGAARREHRDTSVELFGRRLPAPLLLGPVGALELVHDEADLAVARAAAGLGVPMVFSTRRRCRWRTAPPRWATPPRWFQLYWSTSDELVESLVGRAEAAGCDALVVTLDTTMLGWRPRDLDLGHLPFALGKGIAQYTSDPVFRRLVEERAARVGDGRRASPSRGRPRRRCGRCSAWQRRGRARSATTCAHRSPRRRRDVPRHLLAAVDHLGRPGLAAVEDAAADPAQGRAAPRRRPPRARRGRGRRHREAPTAAGRWTARSPRSTPCPRWSARVAGRAPVLLDSGIRTGADAFVAVALGATAVLLGRPRVGLALAGRGGRPAGRLRRAGRSSTSRWA